jgi:glycosidase
MVAFYNHLVDRRARPSGGIRRRAAGCVPVTHWSEHAIFWHVYPLGFVGAPPAAGDPEPVPRLRRLADWFDYLIELGANGLLLGPVFASETHGYDTVDHFRVDPRLGTADDLLWLIEAAHARGVKVVLDGVFNHVGRGFPRLSDVDSQHWFRREPDGALATFEGHHRLAALDHSEPEVADYVVDVMEHWLAHGVDGWRLDAAYAVPTAFWRQVADRVHSAHPDAWLLGEAIHGDYTRLVTEGGLDSVTQYELWKAIWSSLSDGNFYELAHALGRHRELLEVFVPQTFLGNHDVTRIASRLPDGRHLPHAVTILLTVAGIPSVYAGDEQGFTGVKEDREGGDDAVRPPFPDEPGQLSTLGAPTLRLYQELIALRRRHPGLVRARTEVVHLDNTQLVYRSGDTLLVALNLDDGPLAAPLPAGEWTVEAGTAGVHDGRLTVGPHGWAVLADG